jgi:hypothetical protein
LIDVVGDLGAGRLLPESLRQPPVQNHGVGGSGARALNRLGDILGFTEVLLGEAAALAVFPAPDREIIIGAAVNGFGFKSLHVAPVMVAPQVRA